MNKKILIGAVGFNIDKLKSILKEHNFKNDYEIVECKNFADAKEKKCDAFISEHGHPVLSEEIAEFKAPPKIEDIDIKYCEPETHKRGKNSWKNQNKYHG